MLACMAYRTQGRSAARSLVVRNHPVWPTIVFLPLALFFFVAGLAFLAGAWTLRAGEATAAVVMGLALVAIGGATSYAMFKNLVRGETRLEIDASALVITRSDGTEVSLPLERVTGAVVESVRDRGHQPGDLATYRVRVRLDDGESVALDEESSTSSEAHYMKTAAAIEDFLRSR